MSASSMQKDFSQADWKVADPGDAGAISNDLSGTCAITTATAETRTLAAPIRAGVMLTICMETDGGDCVLTVATYVDENDSTTITFDNTGEYVTLRSVYTDTDTIRWRVADYDGVSGVTLNLPSLTYSDNTELVFGTGTDASIDWSTADASNHALVVSLGASQQVHVTDVGATATDWARTAGTHPELAIHSNTTPATDYLAIGNHNGTTATLDVVGGTTLALDIAGTTQASLSAGKLLIGATGGAACYCEGVSFTEAAETTYTGTVEIPAGAIVHNIGFTNTVLWGGTTASLIIGDDNDPNGWFAATNLKATDLLVGEVLCANDDGTWGGKEGVYLTSAGRRGRITAGVDSGWYYGAACEIIFVIEAGTPSTTGRSFGWVNYSLPTFTASTNT